MPKSIPASERRDAFADSTTPLFLSLYLLLLAFFIVLVAMSRVEAVRSHAVLRGVAERFAAAERKRPENAEGILGPAAFFGRAAQVIETAIPAARVAVVGRGRLMEVRFPAIALFADEGRTLRPAQESLIAQLVAAMAAAPEGTRYDVEILIGSGEGGPETALAMSRAGVLARAFVARGAPGASVSAAMEAGDPALVRLIFRAADAVPPGGEGGR